jgi:hypothetical protein
MDIKAIDPISDQWPDERRTMRAERGSALRAELLDAARPIFEVETDGPVEFVVNRLNVMASGHSVRFGSQRPNSVPIDWEDTRYAEDFEAGMFDPAESDFLLRRISNRWTVVAYATGPTDVVWVATGSSPAIGTV